jgi:hypothetical protein
MEAALALKSALKMLISCILVAIEDEKEKRMGRQPFFLF